MPLGYVEKSGVYLFFTQNLHFFTLVFAQVFTLKLGVLCVRGTLKQVISGLRGCRAGTCSVDRVSHKLGGTQHGSFRLFYNNLGAAVVTDLQLPVTDLIFATLQVAYWAARGLSARRGT